MTPVLAWIEIGTRGPEPRSSRFETAEGAFLSMMDREPGVFRSVYLMLDGDRPELVHARLIHDWIEAGRPDRRRVKA